MNERVKMYARVWKLLWVYKKVGMHRLIIFIVPVNDENERTRDTFGIHYATSWMSVTKWGKVILLGAMNGRVGIREDNTWLGPLEIQEWMRKVIAWWISAFRKSLNRWFRYKSLYACMAKMHINIMDFIVYEKAQEDTKQIKKMHVRKWQLQEMRMREGCCIMSTETNSCKEGSKKNNE